MEKIDNKDFLKYLQRNCPSNMGAIQTIRFNKQFITVKINDKQFFFNGLFNERTLYNIIIDYLRGYIVQNNLNIPHDKDFLEYKFPQLNIK